MMKTRLSMKLLFYIVLCSSFFTLLVTAFQLYMDYRRDVAQVHESIQFIESSYLQAIAASAWDMDEKQVTLQLLGALKLQDVEYLEIIEPRTTGEVIIAAQGNPNAKKDIVREFSLEYTNGPEETLRTAKLRVTASLEGVYQRLFSKALIILASNAVKMFLASFCIFLIIQFLITRHITKMARYTQKLEPDKLDKELVLDRKADKSSKPDELYELATSFNDMRVRLNNDIKERSRAEKALRQSEERYRRLVETMTDIVFTLNTEGMFTFLNPEFENLTGYPVRDLIGHPFTEILAPEYIESTVDRFKRGLSGETIPIYEVALKHKDGKTVPVELKVTSLIDDHGKTIGRIGLARDISERARAERALKESEQELRLTLSATTDGIWKWNFLTNELFFSSRYYSMLGYEPDEFPASYESWRNLIHPDDLERALSLAENYIKTKPDTYENEFRLKTKSGDYRWIRATGRVVKRAENGEAVRMIGNHQDITERRQADETLLESEKRLRTILDSIQAGVVIIDVETRTIVDVNPAAIKIIGAPKEQITGHVCHNYICPAEKGACPIIDLGQRVDNSERILISV